MEFFERVLIFKPILLPMDIEQKNSRDTIDYALLPGTTYHFSGPGYILSVAETDTGIQVAVSNSAGDHLTAIAYNVQDQRWDLQPPRGICASPGRSVNADLSHKTITIDSSQTQLSISQYSNKGPLLILADRASGEELSRAWANLFTAISSADQQHRYWNGSDVADQKKQDTLS